MRQAGGRRVDSNLYRLQTGPDRANVHVFPTKREARAFYRQLDSQLRSGSHAIGKRVVVSYAVKADSVTRVMVCMRLP